MRERVYDERKGIPNPRALASFPSPEFHSRFYVGFMDNVVLGKFPASICISVSPANSHSSNYSTQTAARGSVVG
jgi:hypothetical protein